MSSRKNDKKSEQDATNGDDLRRATDWVLNDEMFADVEVHGNARWKNAGVASVVRLAMFWMWSPESSLVEAASDSIKTVTKVFGSAAVRSYQRLTNALQRYGDQIKPKLTSRLHELMEQSDEAALRTGIWLALAIDGSRLNVPRTYRNEQQFCKKKSKSKKKGKKRGRHANRKHAPTHKKKHYDPQPVGPQMWLTLIWSIGQQLPWCWKTGPSYSSERHHVMEMLETEEFPENTLFCGDAGFVGYDFWRAIHDREHKFLVRVGGNVRLLKKLGWYAHERDGTVYCWPDSAMKKKQPPLVLRLIHFRTARNDNIYLVTNVLNQRLLSGSLAQRIYRQRWGIEVQFRSFKQTFERTKLRCRTPEQATVELDWSLFSLWILQLLAYKEQTSLREPTEKTSIAAILRIIRQMMRHAMEPRPAKESLARQLADALVDTYKRTSKKKSRNYPRRKEEPATGKPIILPATQEHKEKLKIGFAATAA